MRNEGVNKMFFKQKENVYLEKHAEYDKLGQYLNSCDFTKQIELDIPIPESFKYLVEFCNQVIVKNDHYIEVTKKLNFIYTKLVSLTSISQMLKLIEDQTKQLGIITGHSKELSSAANQMAVSATNSASFVNNSTSAAASGGQKIQEAIAFMENSFAEFTLVSQRVQDVFNSMREIDNVVAMIAEIADHSNLLALNAAIVAARAAENGRGFAVVAEEVRKLAEHTKDSAKIIRKKIVGLNNDFQETETKISVLTHNMQNGKSIMVDAADALQVIINNFQAISREIHEIAAGTEEQSASLQESTASALKVAENAVRIQDFARITGKGIYEFSVSLRNIKNSMRNDSKLDIYDTLDSFKAGHLSPVWRVYNTVLGFEKNFDTNMFAIGTNCNLNKWIKTPEADVCRSLPSFKRLDDPHRRLHELGSEAILQYQQGNMDKTEKMLEQMNIALQEFVNILTDLQEEYKLHS